MLRPLRTVTLVAVISLANSQCRTCYNHNPWNFNMDYFNDIDSREEDTRDVFNDLAVSLIDAENELKNYCDKNERATEIYNGKEYTCTYSVVDYDTSSINVRIRHRVMRVTVLSSSKILDDVRIIPSGLYTEEASYVVIGGSLTVHIPFGVRRNACAGPRRDTFREHRLVNNRRLLNSLGFVSKAFDRLAYEMYAPESRWQKFLLGHSYTMSRSSCVGDCESGTKAAVTAIKSWLQAHEEAQIMLASVLVVVGLWWLVRTVLALFVNLVCPVLVVMLAVVCVPQLRGPLLGQNYPLVANLLRNILLKMAEKIKA